MNRQKKRSTSFQQADIDQTQVTQHASRKSSSDKKTRHQSVAQRTSSRGVKTQQVSKSFPTYLISTLAFVVLWVLLSWVYGDVFWRVEQNSYVTAYAAQMKSLTDMSLGSLFYAARWFLTLAKYPIVSGLFLSLLLVATSVLLSDVLRLPRRWGWVTLLLPFLYFGWLISRGFNIYYHSEPSWLFIIPLCYAVLVSLAAPFRSRFSFQTRRAGFALLPLLLSGISVVCAFVYLPVSTALWLTLFFVAIAFVAIALICRQSAERCLEQKPFVCALSTLLVVGVALGVTALKVNVNVITTAYMQRQYEEQNWEKMTAAALRVDRPTRSVAAYYAIALEHQDALLEEIFAIPFDFPKVHFDQTENSDEYSLFVPDCNLAAGLVNSAYHEAFEQTVIAGSSLHWFKTMAKAALLNGEEQLAKKYIAILRANPFESAFCDRIEPMIADTSLISSDNELAHIRQLALRDRHPFEQQFRKPVFMGYNMGLNEGPDAVLRTSAAACLYSKDLEAFVPRAQIFVSKGWTLPECMQQALVLYSIKHGGSEFLKPFHVNPMVEQTIASFSRDVAPLIKDKDAMRRELKDDWLGTYVYYYYCENNNPDQVRTRESAGVN